MVRKILFSVFLLTASMALFAQSGRLQLQSEKPTPGQPLQFSYTPNSNLFSVRDTIKCTVYLFGEYTVQELLSQSSKKIKEVKLTKKGNLYQGVVPVDEQTKALAFNFTVGQLKTKRIGDKFVLKRGKFDSNDSLGYVVPLYDKQGNVLPKANFYIGLYLSFGARNYGFANFRLARNYYLKDLEINPEAEMDFVAYFKATFSDNELKDIEPIAKEQINKIVKKDSLTSTDYYLLSQWATTIQLKELSQYFLKERNAKFDGIAPLFVMVKAISEYNKENDLDKKYFLLEKLSTMFDALSDNDKLKFTFSMGLPFNARFYYLDDVMKRGTKEQYKTFAKKLNFDKQNLLFTSMLVHAHFSMLTESKKDLPLAESEAEEYLAYFGEQYEKIKSGKAPSYGVWDDFLDRDSKLEQIQTGRIYICWKLAQLCDTLNDKAKAFSYIAKAKEYLATLPNYFYYTPDIRALYVSLAESQLPEQKLKKELENLVIEGYWNQSLVTTLQRIYTKEKGSEVGFDTYLGGLKQSNLNEVRASVLARQINEPAPPFTLTDLEGKNVSLADFKGKTVILDFWATWCVPCKMSFPGMKKIQTLFQNNPDVVFLFVDTFERFKTVDENKAAVKEFITKNDYPFHVLFDTGSKVSAGLKVSSIPTKIVIDRNGNIRYIAVGAVLEEGKLIDEINAMIESVK